MPESLATHAGAATWLEQSGKGLAPAGAANDDNAIAFVRSPRGKTAVRPTSRRDQGLCRGHWLARPPKLLVQAASAGQAFQIML